MPVRLLAISDIHVGFPANREMFAQLPHCPGDWLILAGDVGETLAHLRFALEVATARFDRVIWVPGNHELWSVTPDEPRGQAKYDAAVALCRQMNVLTPEDPYAVWPGPEPMRIVPMFLLYDYSFRPRHVSEEDAVAWAEESGVVCADEHMLRSEPFANIKAWCEERCRLTEARLEELPTSSPVVLVNHFPLVEAHAVLPMIPRFSIWCGTRRTADWHRRFFASVVVFGHLHIRGTRWLDGVRFEEVSLGYPRQRDAARGIASYLRQILPAGATPQPRAIG